MHGKRLVHTRDHRHARKQILLNLTVSTITMRPWIDTHLAEAVLQ